MKIAFLHFVEEHSDDKINNSLNKLIINNTKINFISDDLNDFEISKQVINKAEITVLFNIFNSSYEFKLINYLIKKKAKYIYYENSYSFCTRNDLACHTNTEIKNCCQSLRFHLYRNFLSKAKLLIFESKQLLKNHHQIFGNYITNKIVAPISIQQNSFFLKTIKESIEEHFNPINFNNALIYKSYGGLGDRFIALPAIYKLKKVCDKLTLAVPKNLVEIFKKNTVGIYIIPFNTKIDFKEYDLVIDLGNYPRSKFDKNENVINYETNNKLLQHASRHYIDAIATLHPEIDNTYTGFPYFKKNKTKNKRFFTVHPGAGFKPKWWSTDKFIKVIIQLLSKLSKYECVVILGPGDPDSSLFQNIKNVKIETGDLDSVVKYISEAAFHIGNDSGITHIAGAYNIPTVAIHGLTGPGAWGTMAENSEIIWGKLGHCNIICKYDTAIHCKNRVCLDSISVEKVLESVYKIIQRNVKMENKRIKYVINPEIKISKINLGFIIKYKKQELLLEFKNDNEFKEFNHLVQNDLFEDEIRENNLKPLLTALKKESIIFSIPV